MPEKYQNYDCGDTGYAMRPYASLYDHAQTFTPQIRHSLTLLGMRLRKKGTPPATYRVRLEGVTNHRPNGIVLAQADFASAPITDLAGGEMKLVEAVAPYIVEIDVEYAMHLYPLTNGDFNNTLMWYWKTETNPYTRGDACSRDGETTWNWHENCDAGFEEWGNPAPPEAVGMMGINRGFDFRGTGFRI